MDSPKSVCSDMSDSRLRLPASIAEASREELQKKLIDALKALKQRDKKLQKLSVVNEELATLKEKNESVDNSSGGASVTTDVLEAANQKSIELVEQVKDLRQENQKLRAEVKALGEQIEGSLQNKEDLQQETEAAKKSLYDAQENSSLLQEQVASMKAALQSMSQDREDALVKVGEYKEQICVLEDALSDANNQLRNISSNEPDPVVHIEQELITSKAKLVELQETLQALSQEKSDVDAKVVALRAELENVHAKSDADSAQFAHSCQEWQNKISQLRNQVVEVSNQLEHEQSAHRETVRAAARVPELESEIFALKNDTSLVNGTVSASYAQELEKAAEKHRTRCQELELEIEKTKKHNMEDSQKLESLDVQLKALKLENERLVESEQLTCKELAQRLVQIDDFRRMEGQLRSDLCELEQQAHQAQAEVSDVEDKILRDREAFNTERTEWTEQVQVLQETIEAFGEFQQNRNDTSVLEAKHAQEMSSLKNQLSQLDNEYEEMREKLIKAEEQHDEVSSEHKLELHKLQSELADLNNSYSALKASKHAAEQNLLGQISTLSSDLERTRAVAGSVPELEAKISNLRKELDSSEDLRSTQKTSTDELESLKSQLVGKDHELEQKSTHVEELEKKLQSSQADRQALQDNLDEKSKDIDEKVSELKELRSEMADMKTALSTSIKDSNHSKEVVEAEREKMKKALGELRKRLDRSTAMNKKLELESAEFRGRVEAEKQSLQTELDSSKSSILQASVELKEYKVKAHALLKSKELELQELKNTAAIQIQSSQTFHDLEDELEATRTEKEDLQDQLVEQEARFSRHLDDLTVDFRTQIDGAEAECAQYRRACEVANEQAENLRAISMDLEARLSTSEQTQKMRIPDAQTVNQDLQKQFDLLKEEHANLQATSEEVMQVKDLEISQLLQTLAKEKSQSRSSHHSHVAASVLKENSGGTDSFIGGNATGQDTMQTIDTFQFGNLLANGSEPASHERKPGNKGLPEGSDDEDSKIVKLAQRQAGRDEELASSLRVNQELEREILNLERELQLRQEQEVVLKNAVRDADRRQAQQENMLDKSVDMEYLKNTVLKLLETGEAEAILPVLAKLLKLSREEEGTALTSIKAVKERQAKAAADAAGGSGGILSSITGWSWSGTT